jgi:hypothetical protein
VPVQTGLEARPASCTKGTGSIPVASQLQRGAECQGCEWVELYLRLPSVSAQACHWVALIMTALVYWLHSTFSVATNKQGQFRLAKKTVWWNPHFILSKVTCYYKSTGVQFTAKMIFFRHHIHVRCGIRCGSQATKIGDTPASKTEHSRLSPILGIQIKATWQPRRLYAFTVQWLPSTQQQTSKHLYFLRLHVAVHHLALCRSHTALEQVHQKKQV